MFTRFVLRLISWLTGNPQGPRNRHERRSLKHQIKRPTKPYWME